MKAPQIPEISPVPQEAPAKSSIPRKSIAKIKHHWMTLSFVFGFMLDNITLNRVDQLFDILVLASYVLLAMIALALLYASAAHKIQGKKGTLARKYAPLLVQFSFGGLLSGMLIFYGRSGAWTQSWPFMLIILLAIYGNETIRDRASRLIYNLAILFIGMFLYVVLIIPVLTGWMGPWVFVGSGLLALGIMHQFIKVIYRIVPNFMSMHTRAIIFTIGSIFFAFNFLYFANIIPPIPLSLKDVGIYHSVVRLEDSAYHLKYEDGRWFEPFKDSDRTFHALPGDPIFCFAQVFAPTKLETDIVHVWEWKNPETKEWEEHARLPYNISGGRGKGFRGYTLITNYADGTWRCSVETTRGQVLGREHFTVDTQSPPRELVTEVR